MTPTPFLTKRTNTIEILPLVVPGIVLPPETNDPAAAAHHPAVVVDRLPTADTTATIDPRARTDRHDPSLLTNHRGRRLPIRLVDPRAAAAAAAAGIVPEAPVPRFIRNEAPRMAVVGDSSIPLVPNQEGRIVHRAVREGIGTRIRHSFFRI